MMYASLLNFLSAFKMLTCLFIFSFIFLSRLERIILNIFKRCCIYFIFIGTQNQKVSIFIQKFHVCWNRNEKLKWATLTNNRFCSPQGVPTWLPLPVKWWQLRDLYNGTNGSLWSYDLLGLVWLQSYIHS